MRIAYFDCFAGVSGNMVLGALLSAGVSQAELEQDLEALNLPGWALRVETGMRKGMSGLHVEVLATRAEHDHRTIKDIDAILTAASLPDSTKESAMQVFSNLAAAEGRVHGVPATEVHFHEVGAVEGIIDVVGAVAGLRRLGVEAIWASPIHVGRGFIQAAHGRMPVPAPATLELLKEVPIYATDVEGELATPTGAVILKTLASQFGSWPAMRVETIGYGLGSKDFAIPNVLRLAIGTLTNEASPLTDTDRDHMEVLEANLDDMNPELCGHVVTELLSHGAVDAFYTPVVGKKGRPGLQLTALAPPAAAAECIETMLRQTTTLGVRRSTVSRVKLAREWLNVSVAGEAVRVKVGRWAGHTANVAPEYEDCYRLARSMGVPLKLVYDQAKAQALVQLGLMPQVTT